MSHADKRIFIIPGCIITSTLLYLLFKYLLNYDTLSKIIVALAILIGCSELVKENITLLLKMNFALDYIAILAIITALYTQEYFAGMIIILMLTGGNSLEKYAKASAKSSLTGLVDRIPHEVVLWKNGVAGKIENISNVKVGKFILVRKGEVIPLDGILQSKSGQTDESSLTGEPYIIDKTQGDKIRSGTINLGEAIVIKVTKAEADSTYKKIVEMVRKAQEEKSPFIRIANKYDLAFTVITLCICLISYLTSHDLKIVLAILVIATPCPLILATPIALIGGMNSAAKDRIIIKKLSSLEALSRVDTLVFDKTGTITLGKPVISNVKIFDKKYSLQKVFSIAESIERNSLHPLAKSIVAFAKSMDAEKSFAKDINENIGSSISGIINNKKYTLKKPAGQEKSSVHLFEEKKVIAEFFFDDALKKDAYENIKYLKGLGFKMYIFTGDKRSAGEKLISQLDEEIILKYDLTPENKKENIEVLKKKGKTTAMIGDGLNDASALALADVGLVFSNEEHTASSEAADIVFLGGNFASVTKAIKTAKRSVKIAKESIFAGIGLSIIGMIFASFGLIQPVAGAFIQEAIDVTVIFNALRASR